MFFTDSLLPRDTVCWKSFSFFLFFFSSGVLAQADSDRWRSGRWKGCMVFLKCSLFSFQDFIPFV